LRDASYYEFFQHRLWPDEALVLEEGLVQRATSLHTSVSEEPDPLDIAGYVQLLPRPDLVILVQTSPDICVERLLARGRHRRYLGKDLAKFVVGSSKTIEAALHTVEKSGWNVII